MRDSSALPIPPVYWPPWARLIGLTCLALVPTAVMKADPRLVVMVALPGTLLLVQGISRHHDDRYMRTFPFSRIDGVSRASEDSPDWRLARAGLMALIYLAVASVGSDPHQIIAALSPASILGIWSNQVPRRIPAWVVVVAMVAGLMGALTYIATDGGSSGYIWRGMALATLMWAASIYIMLGLFMSVVRSRRP